MGKVGIFLGATMAAIAAIVCFNGDSYRFLPSNDVPGLLNLMHGGNGSGATDFEDYDRKQTTDGARDIKMVDQYYNMATDFYEYGWGQSFHFAHTMKDETHDDSILRHEHRLVDVLHIKKGQNVLDAGCGVGGPARAVANKSKAFVKGVTLNEYQIKRARAHTVNQGLTDLVSFEKGDFTKLVDADNTYDAAYGIESTCHSPTLEMVYGEIYRILKPGGRFAVYEWITAKDYDANNKEHQRILTEIEYGNGLPKIRSLEHALKAAQAVGFKVVSEEDLAQDFENTRPWYHRLDMSWVSYYMTHCTVYVLEMFGWAPKGTVQVHGMLLRAADGLVQGGKTNIFTPMHLIVMQKPLAN